MTKKFDGNLWKWLINNVLGKLLPATDDAEDGYVPVYRDGDIAWEAQSTGGGGDNWVTMWTWADASSMKGQTAGSVAAGDLTNNPGWTSNAEIPVGTKFRLTFSSADDNYLRRPTIMVGEITPEYVATTQQNLEKVLGFGCMELRVSQIFHRQVNIRFDIQTQVINWTAGGLFSMSAQPQTATDNSACRLLKVEYCLPNT